MILTYKTRIEVSKEQEEILNNMSIECCQLYNHFLDEKLKHYEKCKKHLSYFDQQIELKSFKCEFLNHNMKIEVLRNLEANFKSFFKLIKKNKGMNPKPPGFKSSEYFFTIVTSLNFVIAKNSIRIGQSRNAKEKFLIINLKSMGPIYGLSSIRKRKIIPQIKQLRIFKKNDKFFISIYYEKKVEENINPIKNLISVDLGKKNLATIYNKDENSAIKFDSKFLNKNLKFHDRRIDELKSKRDNKIKFSSRWKRLNSKISKIYSKKKTQQTLSLHKLSKELTNLNSDIVVGDLTNLKKRTLTPFKKLNRQMQNNWNLTTFIHQLQYKSELNGNKVIKVNEAWTSKTCCGCGCIHENQTLDDRILNCDCGLSIDRDVNGAINILSVYLGDYNSPLETLRVDKRYIRFN